jgi:NifB/MoaA-like Fe-S oxidoreductase
LNERFGTRLHVAAVENDYFGPDIVVAGLLTGSCIVKARVEIRGEFVVVPASVFKSDEAVMLDGTTHAELQEKLARPVQPADFAAFTRLLTQ